MFEININFVDFVGIMEKEISFHRKMFFGADLDEKDRSKKWWLQKYYESLSYVRAKHLEIAFDRCRENYDKFPLVPQLLKFCSPKQVNRAPEVDYTKPVPMTPRMKAQLRHINSGPSRIKLSKPLMDSMKNMCMLRFSGDWTETFNRWDEQNNKRLDA